jgi:hypothetical protein
MKKAMAIVVLILLIQNSIILNAQDFRSLNLPYASFLNKNSFMIKLFDEVYNKKNNSSPKFEYKIDSGFVVNEARIQKRFFSFSFVVYKTPHIDFSNYFYFNENNLCDSIIVYENVCLDCARKENDKFLFLNLYNYEIFVKLSNNEYETSYVEYNPDSPRSKSKNKFNQNKVKYVRLISDPMPITGECKKWTFTLKEGLVYPGIKLPKRI